MAKYLDKAGWFCAGAILVFLFVVVVVDTAVPSHRLSELLLREITLTNILMIAFTAAVAFFTAKLVNATSDLATADRPIIIPFGFQTNGMSDPNPALTAFDIDFDFENVGRTPAYLTRLEFGALGETELAADAAYTEAKDIFMAVAPTRPLGATKPVTIQIPFQSRQRILAGQTTLFLFGRLNFEEISGTKHFQKFAVKFVPGKTGKEQFVNCGPRSHWDHA
jgi:hypothetical protein